MTTFSVEFLGCKVSQTDAQALREALAGAGHTEAARGDVHVVNGCCVTAEAVAKTRKAARGAVRGGAARVFVTGCAARLGGDALSGIGGRVEVVSEPSETAAARVAERVGATGCVGPAPGLERTRAFLKVQDGCSFACSFCVIPRVRGASRSRALAAILEEARRRVAAGHRELVVTGVNLGLFREREAGLRLPGLLLRLADIDGVERVRLSSIEVNHLDEALADAMTHPRLCPHLHVPAQSGDDGVLRAMARRYDAAGYLRAVERVRARVPRLNLTADVIVGHPGEDETAFARTLALVRAAGMTRLHVFPYSPRPGTATQDADPVAPAVKSSRSQRLRALSDALGAAHRARKLGSVERVLVERRDDAGRASRLLGRLHRLGACGRASGDRARRRGARGACGPRPCRGSGGRMIDRLSEQVKDAMRAGDSTRRDTLRLLVNALQQAEKAAQAPLDEEATIQVLKRERKRRVEAAEAFRSAGADERAAAEEAEAEIIDGFLPAELDDAALEAIVRDAVAATGATSPKQMGIVMREAMQATGGRADGKRVQALVRAALDG